jgi:hypothetical protein
MKDEPRVVIHVLTGFKTENATYDLDEIYGVRKSLAKQFVKDGLVEIVKVTEEDEDEKEEETPTGPAWEEPDLGTFHFDDFGWTKRVDVPAFKAFKYRARRRKLPVTCTLAFTTYDEKNKPTPAAVALAKLVLANHAALVTKVADAMWADFTGSGPESGMYWHGDLDQVAQGMVDFNAQGLKPPRSAGDLFKLMRLQDIRIEQPARQSARATSSPLLAQLNFRAAFEQEHGVGILTDGSELLGIGYSGDVSPFKKPAKGRGGSR